MRLRLWSVAAITADACSCYMGRVSSAVQLKADSRQVRTVILSLPHAFCMLLACCVVIVGLIEAEVLAMS
eukprot:2276540-Amphidinium_carterae.1